MELTVKIRLPHEEAPAPWRRMGRYVHLLIREHPLLDDIRRARRGTVVLHFHERAIFATTLAKVDGGGWDIEARIEREGWWLPLKRSHGERLASELAAGIREQWDDQKGTVCP